MLKQRQRSGELKPVAFISRAMTPTERRYAQIEKEALAFTLACERLSDYLTGLRFHIETDHKPLVPLFSTMNLKELPLRVQRFRLRMMRYSFSITHVPGKQLVIAIHSRGLHSLSRPVQITRCRRRQPPLSTSSSIISQQQKSVWRRSQDCRPKTRNVEQSPTSAVQVGPTGRYSPRS